MKTILAFLAAIGMFLLLFLLFTLLWNWLMPTIFGLGKVTIWQALGIVILSRLLFRGFNIAKIVKTLFF